LFRKRKRPTPHFKVPPPFNALHGENANLRQEGVSPFCAMMQVAAADTYENHVICRGFDIRILRFIDYAAGNANKPGISVAKPYGKRRTGTYEIGEIYPALLPTQGNANFMDFRQVVFVPPSPTTVEWRVGQNPGVVTGGLDGGQPENLTDAIEILYDHNGKVINWLLVDSSGSSCSPGGKIQGTLVSLTDSVAEIEIVVAPCDRPELVGEVVEVTDHSGCVFDLPEEDLLGVWVWASEGTIVFSEAACADPDDCLWCADDRCCVDADGGGSSQTFAVGTSGTDFNVASSGSLRTFNLPDASTVNRGVVTTGSQTFGGQKVFDKTVKVQPVTVTPTGTTATIDLGNSNHQTLVLTSSTGNVAVTVTPPPGVSAGTMIVKQHASVVRDLTWSMSSGSVVWIGTEPDWIAEDSVSNIRIVSWVWDGSVMYLAASTAA
jgi:hypothetical protein